MRHMKGMIAGALALGGLAFTQGAAEARPLAAPALINVAAADTGAPATAPTCYYGWHRHYWHPGWRRHYWRPVYGYHRPWGWRRHYGWHRPWGWHHRGWHRGYGWHRW